MLKNIAGSILIAIACCASVTAMAAESCEASSECVNAVSLIGPIDAFMKRCAVFDPKNAEAYREVVPGSSHNLTPEFLAMMRRSAIYTKVVYEANARLDKRGTDKLQEACDGVIKQKR